MAFSFSRTMPRLKMICSALNATVSVVDGETSYRDLFGLLNQNWTSMEGPARKDHVWVGWSGTLFSDVVSYCHCYDVSHNGFLGQSD